MNTPEVPRIPVHLLAVGVSEEDVVILKTDAKPTFLGNATDPTIKRWIDDPNHPLPPPFKVGARDAWTLATLRRVQRELIERSESERQRQLDRSHAAREAALALKTASARSEAREEA